MADGCPSSICHQPLAISHDILFTSGDAAGLTGWRVERMADQLIEHLLRRAGFGASSAVIAVAKDPAMLIWLDGDTNTKTRPQENFGRELMELFSRGVGYYTEDDVYAAARVFTGWNLSEPADRYNASSAFAFIYRAEQHETSAKTFSFPIYADRSRTIPSRSASAG